MIKMARIFMIMTILLMTGIPAYGSRYEFVIKGTDLVLSKPSESVYILKLTLPEKVRGMRIDSATLEYYVEASAENSLENMYIHAFAPIEEISPETGDYSLSPGKWPVFIGLSTAENTRVIMDITSVVKEWQKRQGECYGVIYQSSGDKGVQSILKANELGPDIVAIVKIYAIKR